MASVFDDLTAERANTLQRLDAGETISPEERATREQLAASGLGEFRKGLRRAAYNVSATTDAFAGQMAESFAPDFAARQFAKAEATRQNMPNTLRPAVESFRDVDDVGSAAKYAAGSLGEAATSIGGMVAAGLAARLGLGSALRLGATGKNVAQYGGSMAAMLPQEGGETALTLRNNPEAMANTTPLERTALTAGRGTFNSALESVVPNLLLTNTIAGTARRIAAGTRPALSNIARKSAAGVVGEGATEGAQELTGQYAENLAVPGTGYDIEPVLESAVRGAISGGVLGGAGGTVQAVRSNIDAAAERAAEDVPRGTQVGLNAAVEKIDNLIRNPEEVGFDMADATMGALVEAQARASELGSQVADQAGPAAASGMETIAAIRAKLDNAVVGKLTPENRQKYVELTKDFRLLRPSEYEILRDAFDTGDSTTINKAVGVVSRSLRERVPRETMAGIRSLSNWAKKFGKGVTNAAREGRKAAQSYSKEDVRAFAQYLDENQSAVANTLINSQDNPEQVLRALMAARYNKLSPKDLDVLQKALASVGADATTFFEDIRAAETGVVARPRQTISKLSEREEREAYRGTSAGNRIGENAKTFMTDDVKAQFDELQIEYGPGVTVDDEGQVYDANGNMMDPEDVTNTPYASRELVQRIQSVDTINNNPNKRDPRFNIPVTYKSADGRATPEQIIRLLGSKDLVDGKEVRRDPTDEEIAARVKDGAVVGYISPVALAANTGKEAIEGNPEQGGFKEVFSQFVPDFDKEASNRDMGIQGYRLMSSLASLNSDGIELAPDQIPESMWKELGITKDSEPLKITASLEEGGLDLRTVVQRKYRNGKRRDITMGDLLGISRGKKALNAQKALLEAIATDPNEDNPARKLNQLVDNEGDLTAEAALKGLKWFARDNKLSPNAAVPGYLQQLEHRINDSSRKQRFSAARKALKRAYSAELITEAEMEALAAYKDTEIKTKKVPELEELAVYLQTDLEVDWRTDEELVEMVTEFLDAGMWEVDTARDEFEQNAIQEPTEDDRFDAAMNSPEGGETKRRKAGIDQQNDAAVRAEREKAQREYEARIKREDGLATRENNEDIAREEGRERQRDVDQTMREETANARMSRQRSEAQQTPEVVKQRGRLVADKYRVGLLRSDPDTQFVFGDNLEGRGKGGQAIIRDEPNAFGIPTKRKPARTKDAYFSDRPDEIAAVQARLAELEGQNFRWPEAGIGTGLAQLRERSPQIAQLIHEWAQKNVVDYNNTLAPAQPRPNKIAEGVARKKQTREERVAMIQQEKAKRAAAQQTPEEVAQSEEQDRVDELVRQAEQDSANEPPWQAAIDAENENIADAIREGGGPNADALAAAENAQRVQDEDAAEAAREALLAPSEQDEVLKTKITAQLSNVQELGILNELQEVLQSPEPGTLTVSQAQIIQDAVEVRRTELEAGSLPAYQQRLLSGSEFVGNENIDEPLARTVRGWAKKYLDGAEVRVVEFDENDADVQEFFKLFTGEMAKGTEGKKKRMPLGRAIPANHFGPEHPAMILIKRSGSKLAGTRYGRMHVLAHEFGHIIDRAAFQNAPKEVRDGVDRAYKRLVTDTMAAGVEDGESQAMFNAGSVLRFLRDRKKNSILTGDATFEQGARLISEGIVGRKRLGDRDYIISKTEFFAEQFAKYAMNDPSIFAGESKTVRDYLDRILDSVKRFYNEVIKKFDKTAPEFEAYIKWLGTPVTERPPFPDYDPAQFDERATPTQEQGPPPGPPPLEGTTAEPPGGNTPPPRGPDDRPSPPTPPPPPDNDALSDFRKIVQRMMASRVDVVSADPSTFPEGVAAEYVPGRTLDDINEERRALLREADRIERILKDPNNKTPIDELADPAALRAEAKELTQEAKTFRADLAVRGTIRVANGMEKQAGLAEHETFHAAFDIFFGQGNAEDRKVINTAFTRGVLSNRLIKYFAGNEAVLAVIDPTRKETFKAEEAAAYAFQVFLHEPGALQLGEKVEGIFNKFLAYLQKLVGYKTYEERAITIFNDLSSGKRSERGVSVLRSKTSMEESMLERSRGFVREVGTGIMHMYDTVLSSTYSRLEGSGNPAMAQIARLGYNETGQRGQGMIQLQRLATTKYGNQLKEALHMLDAEELSQLNRAMMLGEEATGKLAEPQKRLRAIFKEAHKYQVDAGIDDLGFQDNYYPMIWNPEKVAADAEGFVEMLNQEKYAEAMNLSMQNAEEIRDNILAFESRGHEFQGVFGQDGEPVADSSKRLSLSFIEKEDRLKYMEDDLVTTVAHYLNQSVRHAEYVRAYGRNGSRLKSLMGEITGTYGGTGADVKLAKDYIDGLMGNKEVGMSRELKDLYGAMTVYQNVRLLPLSVFSSMVDPLGIAIRTGDMTAAFDTFAYSIRNMFTDFRNQKDWHPDWAEKYAEDVGTIDMSGTVKSIDKIFTGNITLRGKTREINDGFFKWNLLNGWVKNNHIMATKYAELFLRRSAESMFGDKKAEQDLEEVGLDREDIIYDEKLGRIRTFSYEFLGYDSAAQMEAQATAEEITEARAQADKIQQAIHKIVRQSLIQPSSAEMPGWMSNPYLAPIAHLKTFVFGFNATILQRLLYEAQRNNYSPILYAAAYVPGMIAFDFIKGFAGNGGEEPEWKKDWGVSDYFGYGVERSGLMGTGQFFTDVNNDVTRGGGGWETLAGPTIEQGTDLMRAMSAKTSEPTRTWMVNAMPVNELYDQWAMR